MTDTLTNRQFNHHKTILNEWNNSNYNKAFSIACDLLKKNPDDFSALYTVGAYYCINGNFVIARHIFLNLIETVDFTNIQRLEFILCSLIRIELNLKNFEAAYNYLQEAQSFFPYIDEETKTLEKYLQCELADDNDNYDYDENLNHVINKHSYYSYKENTDSDHTIFNQDIKIENLFSRISEKLEFIPRKTGFDAFMINYDPRYNDVYFFKIPNCGYSLNSEDTICNYLKVITVPFTNNIISMFPCSTIPSTITPVEFSDYKDIKIKVKTQKTLSQIDKFHQRWG
ncbi:MAG: hypothetical protein HFH45_05750 [Bacilli bacterium]|nr:hypothetical protein [Bacilli bacterium]